MTKLVLIDGNAILHRAYHALPPLTTKHGDPINAVYGLISMLLKIIQDLKPTHIIIAFDRPEKTFRQEEFPAYQSHRPEMEDNLSSQLSKARDVMEAFGIPIYSKAGYEADDVIGTIAEKAVKMTNDKLQMTNEKGSEASKMRHPVDEVVIVTGDRDILQLVNEKVKVYMPVIGLSEGKLLGINDVKEKMGCTPEQIIDYKALVGDASDNYPGVPGIGPKTANNLLEKYGSFDNIYKHLDEISPSIKNKLEKGKESGELSKHLATIVREVEVPLDFELAKKWRVDSDDVLALFNEYGFKTLTNRVKEVGKGIVSENQGSLF
jgi:DNA polymerase-1